MDELLKEMQKIGFTTYEAKIYIALLQQNPATGYEISKLSGVPQAKVYENISRLNNSGTILTIAGEPAKYVPLPPEELLKKVQNKFKKSINILRESLPPLSAQQHIDYAWNIKGYDLIMQKASQMINEAKDNIMVSLWDEEAMDLYNDLIKAVNRGVFLSVMIYGKNKIEGIDEIYYHGGEETLVKQVGERWLTLVADRKEVLTGQVTPKSDGVSVWTLNPSIVFTSLRYIEHEIYISKNSGEHK